MNAFDLWVTHFLNQFAQRSFVFDQVVSHLTGTKMKGILVFALLWGVWFHKSESQTRNRQLVICGFATSIFAIFVARVLALFLPFRVRPIHASNLDFHKPFGATGESLIGWSSFPSDHAVFYFCLATCLFLVSKRIGILCYLYTFFVICLPRLYVGIHYASDIVVGAILGIAIGSLALNQYVLKFTARLPMRYAEQYPGVFYAAAFLMSFFGALQFEPLRSAAVFLWHVIIPAL